MRKLIYSDLKKINYKEAWDLQYDLFNLRVDKKIDDVLLLLEHPHTYTLGKTADRNHLLISNDELNAKEISVFDIDRGGDITYHGPGQIVGYPVIDLTEWQKDTHKYLRALEEVIIKTLQEYGLEGSRNQKYTGVWIDDKKIAAIGIKVSRWVTMHGFAFNVNTDLTLFNGIIPCGILDKKVTSLKNELGEDVNLNDVKLVLLNSFKEVFKYDHVMPEVHIRSLINISQPVI
jgi:lipoyl(octanoyl) transferase